MKAPTNATKPVVFCKITLLISNTFDFFVKPKEHVFRKVYIRKVDMPGTTFSDCVGNISDKSTYYYPQWIQLLIVFGELNKEYDNLPRELTQF
jgi:hypothetical protein